VSGCHNIENVDHLLLGCEFFENILLLAARWFGIQYVNLYLSDHLLQIGQLFNFFLKVFGCRYILYGYRVLVIEKDQNRHIF